jgi:hypothetical protein
VKPLDSGDSNVPAGSFAKVLYWANRNTPFTIGFFNQPRISPAQRQVQDALDGQTEPFFSDVHIVRDETSPQVRIVVEEGAINFERKDELLRVSGSVPILDWKRVGHENIWSIISNVARFNMHLYRENPVHPYRSRVSLSLHTLKGFKPQDDDQLSNGIASLQYTPGLEERYVFVINNLSYKDLWCSLHYSDYSITNMYTPPAINMAPPLRKGSSLTVGHGGLGVPPFTFTVRDLEQENAGFVKLFLSEHYADLTLLDQGGIAREALHPSVSRRFEKPQIDGEQDTITTAADVEEETDRSVAGPIRLLPDHRKSQHGLDRANWDTITATISVRRVIPELSEATLPYNPIQHQGTDREVCDLVFYPRAPC